ncbi:MAG: FAD-dependent oxidoreductase [Acidobacteriota bacterium]
MNLEYRKQQLTAIKQTDFDVAIIGGGISGAAIFNHLALKGYRILLVDKGDFAGGTSQSSAMMAWANIHDLRKLSFIKIARLCASRERLIRDRAEWVVPRSFRYLPTSAVGRKPFVSYLALYTYWLLGAGRRSIPHYQKDFSELAFLEREKFPYSFDYQEAALEPSDARFVLGWILEQQNCAEQIALNYCLLQGGRYSSADKHWHLEIFDSIFETETVVKAKCVINAAGVWTDRLNQQFGIKSPYKHAFGKGVFIGINRPASHNSTLMVETVEYEGNLGLIPWGPISLWGTTETRVTNPEDGFSIEPSDVQFLIKELNRHLSKPISTQDIVSLRCGVRPLSVNVSAVETGETIGIPREYKIYADKEIPWISIYGGKITSCVSAAESVDRLLQQFRLKPNRIPPTAPTFDVSTPELEDFPTLDEKVLSANYCAEKEMCWTLDDYLRRRTNISQWVARGGLGLNNENLQHLTDIARIFCDNDDAKANLAINAYKQKIKREFDELLANVN